MDEEDSLVWQEVLDELAAGLNKRIQCPFCKIQNRNTDLRIEETNGKMRIDCPQCKRFIEGRMAGES